MPTEPAKTKSPRKAIVRHGQTIRLSANYNSVEISYGVELQAKDDPIAIEKALKRAEGIVEKHLSAKIPARIKTLEKYAK